jgi:uncharacterized membrane protein YbaN (DUF454 family)
MPDEKAQNWTGPSEKAVRRRRSVRAFYVLIGTIFLALGAIGAVLPLLPTTPFLILAAACYARGSERMHKWLLSNRLFGKTVRDYTLKRGITPRARYVALAVLWSMLVLSMFLMGWSPLVVVLLLVVGAGVSIHLVTLRTIVDAAE